MFLIVSTLTCGMTGYMAHKEKEDTIWNHLDVAFVQSVAIIHLLYPIMFIHSLLIWICYGLCVMASIQVLQQFKRLKKSWDERVHCVTVQWPSFFIIACLPFLRDYKQPIHI